MILAGKSVRLRLSPEGEQALEGSFPDARFFPAYVEAEDENGIWVRITKRTRAATGAIPVILLKWHYFSTVVIDFLPEEVPGFGRTEPRRNKGAKK